MVKRIGWLIIVLALGAAVAADAAQPGGSLSGTARDGKGQVASNAKLQVRNLDTGQVVASGRSSADGSYRFTGLPQGNYVVEILDDSDKVAGVSAAAALAAGGAVTGLAVASAAVAGGAFFASTAGILLLVGIGAGVTAGVIAATNDASPSR